MQRGVKKDEPHSLPISVRIYLVGGSIGHVVKLVASLINLSAGQCNFDTGKSGRPPSEICMGS